MEPKAESKYERLRKIGIGSYGVVFKCVNRQSGQIVAIKRYSENDTDPIIRKIAMREVRMLRQLKHPNLIQLIEVFRRKRRLHLVFDYCELTVLDVIEKYANNCPLNLIRKIIWQLVNGVSYCHSHNCIHRDIKPENILINQSGVVKLCDFGFARNFTSTQLAGSVGQQPTSSKPQTSIMSPRTGPRASMANQVDRDSRLLGVVPTAGAAANSSLSGPTGSPVQPNNPRAQQLIAANFDNNKENLSTVMKTTTTTATPQQPDATMGQLESGPRLALTEYVATRWYRAPELLVGEIYYDTKIDIWAIGCVTAELMRGEPIWPGKTDLDQLYMIKNTLGPLTVGQTHTLLTQNLYDQANIERLLEQPTNRMEPLERKLPTRIGQLGVEFVRACLQMDPTRRPSSDRLLLHPYIHSARMAQFVKGAGAPSSPGCPSGKTADDKGLGGAGAEQPQASSKLLSLSSTNSTRSNQSSQAGAHQRHKSFASSTTTATTSSRLHASNSGPGRDSNELKWMQVQQPNRSNSQALILAANGGGAGPKQQAPAAGIATNQLANKRLAMAPSGQAAKQRQLQHPPPPPANRQLGDHLTPSKQSNTNTGKPVVVQPRKRRPSPAEPAKSVAGVGSSTTRPSLVPVMVVPTRRQGASGAGTFVRDLERIS